VRGRRELLGRDSAQNAVFVPSLSFGGVVLEEF